MREGCERRGVRERGGDERRGEKGVGGEAGL